MTRNCGRVSKCYDEELWCVVSGEPCQRVLRRGTVVRSKRGTVSASVLLFSLLFSTGQTVVKLSGAQAAAADRAQCYAPNKPIGY